MSACHAGMLADNWTPVESTCYPLLSPCDLPTVFCEGIVMLECYALYREEM